MSRLCCLATAALVCLAFRPEPARAAVAPLGAQAAACASCHGPAPESPGLPASGIRSLTGMDQASIARALGDYRSGLRKSQIMQVVAGALSPGEIDEVAREIAFLPVDPIQ